MFFIAFKWFLTSFDRKLFGRQPFGQQSFGWQPFGRQPFGRQPFAWQSLARQPFGRQHFGLYPFGRQPIDRHPFGDLHKVCLSQLWPCHLVERHSTYTMRGWKSSSHDQHTSWLLKNFLLLQCQPSVYRANGFWPKCMEPLKYDGVFAFNCLTKLCFSSHFMFNTGGVVAVIVSAPIKWIVIH